MALNVIKIGLDKSNKRPMFDIKTDTGYATCLLDTGAVMPVWCDEIDVLKVIFPNVKKTNLVTIISGFGGDENTLSEIWEIPSLSFNDRSSNSSLTFNRVLLAILKKETFSFDLILPATMFGKMNYKIVNLEDKCLEISFERIDEPYQVVPVAKVNDSFLRFEDISSRDKDIIKTLGEGRLIKGISLFPQDL